MKKWETHIPDRTRIARPDGTTFVIFNPPWWRVDRWLAWLWLSRVRNVPRAFLKFTAVARDKDGHRLEEFQLPAHVEEQ